MTFDKAAARRRRTGSLQQMSLLDAPLPLLRRIRGLTSSRTLTWLACVPIALMGLGLFNLSAHAAELPELTPAFLANNGFVLFCAALVIFMNAGFAMVEEPERGTKAFGLTRGKFENARADLYLRFRLPCHQRPCSPGPQNLDSSESS